MGPHVWGTLTKCIHQFYVDCNICELNLHALYLKDLKKYGIELLAIQQNLIDDIWKESRPRPQMKNLIVLDVMYSGILQLRVKGLGYQLAIRISSYHFVVTVTFERKQKV